MNVNIMLCKHVKKLYFHLRVKIMVYIVCVFDDYIKINLKIIYYN